MNKSKIIERIERQLGGVDLVSLLVDRLPPTDLQSALIEVYRQIAARRNQHKAAVRWQFDVQQARSKLGRPYPQLS